MSDRALEIEQAAGVATVWLSRPEVHNAFDAGLVLSLTETFHELERAPEVRAIVLAARGRSFCAGAQVQWMREQGEASSEENANDARRLAQMFKAIAHCGKPTVARVQGAALGGGVGLVAACDIALGSASAMFGITEVRLGLIPATIAPYVVRVIGERQARRYFQTGERFDARTAEQIGLLHEAVDPDLLDARVDAVTQALLAGAPAAQQEAKALLDAVATHAVTDAMIEDTALRIARRREHAEAREGLDAFLGKRAANWAPAR